MHTNRPTRAAIDLAALRRNIGAIRRQVGQARMLAAVKADAYGHGAVECAKAAVAAGAEMLGVATVEEAAELREHGVEAPIVALGYLPPKDALDIVRLRVRPMVSDLDLPRALIRRRAPDDPDIPVHVMVDTGMGRTGVIAREAVRFVQTLAAIPGIRVEGIATHFPSSDEADKGFTLEQIATFSRICDYLRAGSISVPVRHAANSGAILDLPTSYFDMVRPGLMLYGLYPTPDMSRSVPLEPVMALKSVIVLLRDVPKGWCVSYGRTFTTQRPSKLGVVPIGYADGLPRGLSNRGAMLVRGRRAPIAGRVCMDQCVLDVTGIPGVAEGDEVVVYGRQGDEEIRVEDVAETVGAIPNELVCAVSKRVPRVFCWEGKTG